METVLVGMSGGVDSTVAAFLLKQAGYKVTGATLRLWKATNPDEAWYQAQEAMVVGTAQHMGIDLEIIDARQEFFQRVVGYFISGYSSGVTPNPCFYCNRALKFDILQDFADKNGIQWLAGGHYARIVRDASGVRLLRGIDLQKDQSYMLSSLEKQKINRLLLPLGEMTKEETRLIARQQGFLAADTDESQDACFLPEGDYASFLRQYNDQVVNPGDIVNQQGEVLGQHQGLAFYTIGQRKGLGVFAPEPTYVLCKDLENNHLIVGKQEDLGSDTFLVSNLNWLTRDEPVFPMTCEVMIRYQSRLFRGELTEKKPGTLQVGLQRKARDVTPGQAAVFFEGDEVLGSGIIDI